MHKLLLATVLFAAPALTAEPLRVMSYNVRLLTPDDGADVWEKRRDILIESIRQARPDVIGTQELFKVQGDYIVQSLPEYAWFGTSRRGNEQDEHMGIFYRTDRLKLVEQGQFWLSETPNIPGSQSWGTGLPRMVTWGLFEADGKRFYLLNTHFAHRREDEEARLKSVAVIESQVRRLRKGYPMVVSGDFNAPAGGPVHAAMLRLGLKDSRELAERKAGPEGTFHGFRGTPGESRIDWILISPEWKVLRNETVTFSQKGRYPSDHFPVIAEVDLTGR